MRNSSRFASSAAAVSLLLAGGVANATDYPSWTEVGKSLTMSNSSLCSDVVNNPKNCQEIASEPGNDFLQFSVDIGDYTYFITTIDDGQGFVDQSMVRRNKKDNTSVQNGIRTNQSIVSPNNQSNVAVFKSDSKITSGWGSLHEGAGGTTNTFVNILQTIEDPGRSDMNDAFSTAFDYKSEFNPNGGASGMVGYDLEIRQLNGLQDDKSNAAFVLRDAKVKADGSVVKPGATTGVTNLSWVEGDQVKFKWIGQDIVTSTDPAAGGSIETYMGYVGWEKNGDVAGALTDVAVDNKGLAAQPWIWSDTYGINKPCLADPTGDTCGTAVR